MTDGALARTTRPRDGDQLSHAALEVDAAQNWPSVVSEIHLLKDDDRLLLNAGRRGRQRRLELSRYGWRWGGREDRLDPTQRRHRTLCQADHPPQRGQRSGQQSHIADERHELAQREAAGHHLTASE